MSTYGTFQLIRSKVRGAMGTDRKIVGYCPGHEDKSKRSFSAELKPDGTITLHCFVGCPFDNLCTALGIEQRDCFADGGGEGSYIPPDNTATLQQSPGCTLEQFAESKNLPIEFLKANGIIQISYQGAPAVRIPYYDAGGVVKATRYRIAATGNDRFRWKSGDKTMLYGWNWRQDAIDQGFVVLCEGESDALTLRLQGIPTVAIPGANTFRDERDSSFFDGIENIYVVTEPDLGGEAVKSWLAKSSIRDRAYLLDLGEHKDPSGLYLAAGDAFIAEFASALDRAPRWSDIEYDDTEERKATAFAQCKDLAREPDILAKVADTVHQLGLAGEYGNVKLMYLVLNSRHLEKPVSTVVKGASSAGKSFLVEMVLNLFSPRAYYALSGMSERALAYSEEPLSHRFLVIYEAAGVASDFATYLLRSLISEGRVRYETVEKTNEGVQAKLIEREGPTGVILTTTAAKLHPENETRLLSLLVTDTPEHTKRVMLATAALARDGSTGKAPLDLSAWHALQDWLETGPSQVVVPFAVPLADLIPPDAVRLRRDFGLVIALIRSHALLHRATRQLDSTGRIEATVKDYGAVRDLVADLVAAGVEATVPASVRETVQAARELLDAAAPSISGEKPTISLAPLAKRLRLDKSATSRRVRVAIEREYLLNLESRRGKPMRLAIGDPLPDERPILPSVAELVERCTVAGDSEGVYVPSPPRNDERIQAEPVERSNRDDTSDVLDPWDTNGVPCPDCGVPMVIGQCRGCTDDVIRRASGEAA